MPDSVIVTIERQGEKRDFEVPFRLPVKEWKNQLLPAFGTEGALLFEGRPLAEEGSFWQYGIYDGAELIFLPSRPGRRKCDET